MNEIKVLDHGYVKLRNISGPTRRNERAFDADDIDPANSARFSFDGADQEERTRNADLKLTSYLIKNNHNTPIEMITVWLEMKLPIFVARQFVRHRTVSINEISARYVKLEPEFYIPLVKNVGVKSENNKQGRVISTDPKDIESSALTFIKILKSDNERCYGNYERAIRAGIPNELARLHLPLNIYTKWLWKQDLHNLFHFLSLRTHEHAQFEAREYANAIFDLLKEVIPDLMEMYKEFRE